MTSSANNLSQKPFLFDLPQGIGECILSYLDNPKDLLTLSQINKQTHQFLNHTDSNTLISEKENNLHRMFTDRGILWPTLDSENSVSKFLSANKRLITKVQKDTLTDSNEDLVMLAQTNPPQIPLIRKVFEKALAINPSNSSIPYSRFNTFFNNSTIEMGNRRIVFYALTSSPKCNQKYIAVKGTMNIHQKALEMAATNCDISYIENKLYQLKPEDLGTAFEQAILKYCTTKEQKYEDFWKKIVDEHFKNLPPRNQYEALNIAGQYGYELPLDILENLWKDQDFPFSTWLKNVIQQAHLNKKTNFLEKAISTELFKKNLDVFELVIKFPEISDETLASWIGTLIKMNYTLVKNNNRLPYLLIEHKRGLTLGALASGGGLTIQRCYDLCSFVRVIPSPFRIKPIGHQTNNPKLSDNNIPTVYQLDEPQSEVLPDSSELIEKALCSTPSIMGDSLIFLSANGYINGVKSLLNKASQQDVNTAFIQAVTYRCEEVVKLILKQSRHLILRKSYIQALRIGAIGGFKEIFNQLLSLPQPLLSENVPALHSLKESLLYDATVYGKIGIVRDLLDLFKKSQPISSKGLEKCLTGIESLITMEKTNENYLKILSSIASLDEINNCQTKLLTSILIKLISSPSTKKAFNREINSTPLRNQSSLNQSIHDKSSLLEDCQNCIIVLLLNTPPKKWKEQFSAKDLGIEKTPNQETLKEAMAWLMEAALYSEIEEIIIKLNDLKRFIN